MADSQGGARHDSYTTQAEAKHQWILKIFSQDDQILKELAAEFNNNAPYFNIAEIAKITMTDLEQSRSYLFALSYTVHSYTSHKEKFQEVLTTVLNPVQKQIHLFMRLLNKNGINGLQTQFYGESQYRSEGNKIYSTNDEFILKIIYDEDEKPIGEFPLVKLSIRKIDHKNQRSIESFLMPLNALKSLGQYLVNAYDENMTYAKQYKKKLGNSVVIYDEG